MKKTTRYTVTVVYDIWAKNDKSACKRANKLTKKSKIGSNPRVFELDETPFGSFDSRSVDIKEIESEKFNEKDSNSMVDIFPEYFG
jgi:hypothetical protein